MYSVLVLVHIPRFDSVIALSRGAPCLRGGTRLRLFTEEECGFL